MIICLCRRISDRDIVQSVQAGLREFEQLQDATGLATHCGCCHDTAREVFEQACGGSRACACAGHAAAGATETA